LPHPSPHAPVLPKLKTMPENQVSLAARIDRVIDDAIARQSIVGAVVLVCKHGEEIYARTAGHADREAGIPVHADTIFRLASVTKPFVAATALAMIAEGKIGLEDQVRDYLPWFHPLTPGGDAARITIRHLLTHTSGLGYDAAQEQRGPGKSVTLGIVDTDLDYETNFRPLNEFPLAFAPGEAWSYSIGTDILGALLAAVHGPTLEATIAHYVTGPLGLGDCAFHVTDRNRLAKAYADNAVPGEPAIIMPEPYHAPGEAGWKAGFSPNRLFNLKAFQSGGAGMVGTAPQVMLFLDTLARGGGSILPAELAAAGFANQIGDIESEPGMRFGYFGAVCHDPIAANSPLPVGAVQWGGVYGNTWLVDRERGLTMVSLSNTALEGCMGLFTDHLRRAIYAG
jgi:CubicO group peptidase (beta-lactamase class C family)